MISAVLHYNNLLVWTAGYLVGKSFRQAGDYVRKTSFEP